MLPCPLGHLGVCAGEVGFRELEIEHRLTLGLILGIDDLPAFLLVYLSEAGAFSRFGIDTIEGSVAASAVNETVACFHAKGAIANLNEPASEALASSGRVRPCSRKVPRE